MKKVLIFGKPTCPVCKDAHKKVRYFKKKKHFNADILYYDMETIDGLSEGAFNDVDDIPSVIVEKEGKGGTMRYFAVTKAPSGPHECWKILGKDMAAKLKGK